MLIVDQVYNIRELITIRVCRPLSYSSTSQPQSDSLYSLRGYATVLYRSLPAASVPYQPARLVRSHVVHGGVMYSLLVRNSVPARLQVFDESMLASESVAKNSAFAEREVAIEAGWGTMNFFDVPRQVALAAICLGACWKGTLVK